MQQRRLGQGGPMVSAIGLGCMSFGGIFGATTEADSHATLDAAWSAGITFFDTANVYGAGVSETVLGNWLKSRRPQAVVATKAAIIHGPPRAIDNSAAHLRAELEGSLRRLGTGRVDLFYLHRHDAATPIEEVAMTMAALQAEGMIGGYGLSEVSPATLRRAHAVHPVTAVQSEYSLWSRMPELGLIRACTELGVAFVPFSPLGRGIFGDVPMAPPSDIFRAHSPRFVAPNLAANNRIVEGFRAFSRSRGWPVAATAIAWLLDHAGGLIPIPGTRSADHLVQWAGAGRIDFSDEDRREIDRLLPPGFAHGDRYSDAQIVGVERYC